MRAETALAALRQKAWANPLAVFEPTSQQQKLFDAIDRGARQIILRWPNKAGKTVALAYLAAALASGYTAPWLPARFRRLCGQPLVILVMVPDLGTSAIDYERLQLAASPEDTLDRRHEKGRSVVGAPLREASDHSIGYRSTGSVVRVMSWDALSNEKARRKLQGPNAHLVLLPEEAPPAVWGEMVARTTETGGCVIMAGTLALNVSAHDHRLDTNWYRENVASRAPWCGDSNCQHTGEDDPMFAEVHAILDRRTVPWMTACQHEVCICGRPDCDRRIRDQINATPEAERPTRCFAAWGRELKGRCYSAFYDAQHQEDTTQLDLSNSLPGGGVNCRIYLITDCGGRDATACILAAVHEWPCPGCSVKSPGEQLCWDCRGRGCGLCRNKGRTACQVCEGRGAQPEVWVLAEYQSTEGCNDTGDNAAGTLDAIADAGFWRLVGGRREGDASAIDEGVGDNMMPKRFADFKGELQALHSRLGTSLPWTYVAANKRPSMVSSWDWTNDMMKKGRYHVAKRCKKTRAVMSSWSYGPDGALPKHGGAQGPSHLDACLRYLANAIRDRDCRAIYAR